MNVPFVFRTRTPLAASVSTVVVRVSFSISLSLLRSPNESILISRVLPFSILYKSSKDTGASLTALTFIVTFIVSVVNDLSLVTYANESGP